MYGLHMEVFWICVGIAVVVFGTMIYCLLKFRHSRAPFPTPPWCTARRWRSSGPSSPSHPGRHGGPGGRPHPETGRHAQFRTVDPRHRLPVEVAVPVHECRRGRRFFSTLKQDSNFARQLDSGIDPKSVPNYLLDVDKPLVIPSGTKVRLLLTSMDVIHAWWVPDFGAKRSAIPGFVNELWFKVDSGQGRHLPRSMRRAVRPRPWLHARGRRRAHARRLQEMGRGAEGGHEAGGRARETPAAAPAAASRMTARRRSRPKSELNPFNRYHFREYAHGPRHRCSRRPRRPPR
jgi:hypothetical protein